MTMLLSLLGLGATAITTTAAGEMGKVLLGVAALDVADQMLEDAYQEGYKKASAEYKEKFGRQVLAFQRKEKDLKRDKQEYLRLINDMENYIRDQEREIQQLQRNNSNDKAQFVKLKKECAQQGLSELRSLS